MAKYSARTERTALGAGFTLVELLVVIAIIGILVALLLPAVQAAREAARRSQCRNNLKQLALATHGHHDVVRALPIGIYNDASRGVDGPEVGMGWGAKVLPYFEETQLYDLITTQVPLLANVNNPWDAVSSKSDSWINVFAAAVNNGDPMPGATVRIASFVCPTSDMPEYKPSGASLFGGLDDGYAVASYKACQGPIDNGMFFKRGDGAVVGEVEFLPEFLGGQGPTLVLAKMARRSIRFKDVTDGLSKTIALGESAYEVDNAFPHWIGAPRNDESVLFKTLFTDSNSRSIMPNCGSDLTTPYPFTDDERATASNDCAYSWHPGGTMFAFGDGSVHFLPFEISPRVYILLGAINDGEVIDSSEINL